MIRSRGCAVALLLLAVALGVPAGAQSKDIPELLERGDAAAALERARQDGSAAAGQPEVLRVAYMAAVAAGDAQLAEECLKKLADRADAAEKARIARRRQWLVGVGREAPDATIRCEDGSTFRTATRGDKVLVIDFWNSLAAPPTEHIEALKKLHADLRDDRNVEFVGVNADAAARLETARGLVQSNGLAWPQAYEETATNAPITHGAFKAGNPPWLVVIDSFATIRAVGAADEPGVVYALRAAIAEARGDFEPVMPRTRDGRQVARPGSRGELAKAAEKAAAERPAKKPEPPGELPSNADARSLLTQAHTLRRGGNKTKARELYQRIVQDYPGTKEAQEAQEWLE